VAGGEEPSCDGRAQKGCYSVRRQCESLPHSAIKQEVSKSSGLLERSCDSSPNLVDVVGGGNENRREKGEESSAEEAK
jgi:hypothetical protein